MDAEPPPRGEPDRPGRRKARRALWFAAAGLAVGLATAIACALHDTSTRFAIMLGVPAALLTFGGLTIALGSDPDSVERHGFRTGFTAGSLRRWWRSVLDRFGDGSG